MTDANHERIVQEHSCYTPLHRCVACKCILGRIRFHNGGVCPNCGHVSNGTICDTTIEVARWVEDDVPWWAFWRSRNGRWESKKGETI